MIDRLVLSSGVAVPVQDHASGNGAPLLLVHGGARSLADWDAVVPDLVAEHRVVTLDVRSHGQSMTDAPWTFGDVVADIDAVIAELGLVDPIIGGHSMGGTIATLYAQAHPRCAGIVNVDGSGAALPRSIPGVDDGPRRMAELVASHAAELARTAGDPEVGDAVWVESKVAEIAALADTYGLDGSLLEAATRRLYAPAGEGRFQANPPPRPWATAYAALGGIQTFEILHTLTCPLLYVKATRHDPGDATGDETELLAAHNLGCELELDQLAATKPRFELARIECGHMVPLERPRQLAALILDFARRASV